MQERRIGKLVKYLRTAKGMRMKDVYQGICSESAYIRLENGESLPEFLTLSYLFSRLGKSANKCSMLMGYEEYEVYCMQEKIERLVTDGNYCEAEKMIEMYKEYKNANLSVHQQYIMKMQAVIMLEKRDYKGARRYAENALKQTLPGFDADKNGAYLLGEEEWTLIFIWLQCGIYLGDRGISEQCRNILGILKVRQMDIEMLSALFPKAVWLLAESLERDGKIEKVKSAVEETIELLVRNSSIICLPQMLMLLQKTSTPESEAAKRAEGQRRALEWSYESVGNRIDTARINLWQTYRKSTFYLLPETVKGEREQSGLSQESLAEKSRLDVKTLSRIETGANYPKNGTFRKVMDALNCEYDIYRTNLVTEDFALLEMERKISEKMMKAEYVEARELLQELGGKLSTAYKENLQYLDYTAAILDVMEQKISRREALDLCIKAFERTRPFEPQAFRRTMLGVEEIVIVNFIAMMYRKLGEEQRAIELLEAVLAGFDSSKVADKYHHKELTLILDGLAHYCEIHDELNKAWEYCQRGVRLQIECGKGGVLGSLLMQGIYIEERMGEDVEACKKEYLMTYQILEVMQMHYDKSALERYYNSQYGTEIKKEVKHRLH